MNGLNISGEVSLPGDETTQETSAKNVVLNGRTTPTNLNFLCNKVDETGCNEDCIYKNSAQSLDDSADILSNVEIKTNGIAQCENNIIRNGDVGERNSTKAIVISNNDKTEVDDKELQFECEIDFPNSFKDVNAFESICLKSKCEEKATKGDINHNGDIKGDDLDSDTECTEPSESKSENTVCDGGLLKQEIEKSVETSTETLVSENFKCNSSPKEINGFEKVSNPDVFNGNTDYCKICTQNIKFINGKHRYFFLF